MRLRRPGFVTWQIGTVMEAALGLSLQERGPEPSRPYSDHPPSTITAVPVVKALSSAAR